MLCFQSVLYCIVLYNDVFTFLYVAVGNKLLLLLLPEETGVQLMCAASYDIWCRDMDTDQTSTEQTAAAQTKMEEVCSTSHTKIEGPTSGSGRGQKS